MIKKWWIFILLLAFMLPENADAQRWKLRRYEGVIGLSTSHPFMDIAGSAEGLKSFHWQGTRPNITAGLRFKILENLSVGTDLSYLMFGGIDLEDRLSVHSFMTHSFEHVLTVQFDFINQGKPLGSTSAVYNRRGMVNNFTGIGAYIFAGFGGIMTKSIARDSNNEIVEDDQFFNNNLNYGIVFPMGLGIDYALNSYWSISFEVGGRFTLSDLLDGYATPFSEYDDRYILTCFKAKYKIRNDRRGLPVFSKYGRR